MNSPLARRAELAFLILLTLSAFAVRAFRVGDLGLAEDETAKWQAIQQYRHGHFAGVNSLHPMLPKLLAWGSLALGERWNRWAGQRGWPAVREESWLRLPNLFLGAATAAILYLLGRQMMGMAGAGAAAFFWAFTPLPIALNRVLKEDTPLTFFTLLAFYFFWRAKHAQTDADTRHWVNWSGVGFGLALASKYLPCFFGMNWTVWPIAGRAGLDRRPLLPYIWRQFLVLTVVFVLANPVVLSPTHLGSIWHKVEGAEIQHNGYNLNGQLYLETPSVIPSGLPWYFYLWVLGVKTPLPVLAAFLLGAVLLLRDRRTMASIFFRVMVLIQLLGLSVIGPKWIRYMLPLLPFVYLTAGYAIERLAEWLPAYAAPRVARPAFALAALALFVWPLAETLAWQPYYSLYLNRLGGGRANAARYFPHDEIYDLGTREAVETACRIVPAGARLAAGNPATVAYYLEKCGRSDIRAVPTYDLNYVPRPGDFILVQDSRRYFETRELFDFLQRRGPPLREIYVGGVLTGQIYQFGAEPPRVISSLTTRRPESR